MTRDELIAALEQAEVGSRELDIEIHKALGCKATNEKALAPDQIESWFRTFALAYTTDLDAALPGENIIHVVYRGFVPHPERIEQWEAAHAVIEDGKMVDCIWGRAKTEPLARRIACLKATQP